MEQVRPQQESLHKNPEVTKGITTVDLKPTATRAKSSQKLTLSRNVTMFFGWAAAGAAIVILLWWAKPDRTNDDMSLILLETDETAQAGPAASFPEQPLLTKAAGDVESMPPPVVADHTGSETPVLTTLGAEAVAEGQSNSRKPVPDVASKAAVIERQDLATREQHAVSADKAGPWVINLLSSSSKVDADRMEEKARSRAIQTEQQPVIVKGNQYWRVQIAGFPTEEAARAYANTAKEKLGLQDVWIMKR